MAKQVLAIALCRVSSVEQLNNNSLATQKGNVFKAAKELGVVIPDDGLWEGQVSSKKGVNFNRKDLLEMYDYCKNHKAVRYLIVQEVDRFMRSPEEQTYWYVRFDRELGVKVWFADKPELNEDNHQASLFRFLEGWRAGGSNEERISKSISGQTAALQEGRYPFSPKPGYRRGYERGIQEPDEVRAPILKRLLERIASRQITPTQALIELNKSDFVKGRALYKMDKFRKIVTDPFYAGIVEINKQVKVRNENGKHIALITKDQHLELVGIMDAKKKNQAGPRKNGNPKYPLSNHVTCSLCLESSIGRYVGFDHGNGKNPNLVYEKYRCRSCGRYLTRQELHEKVMAQLSAIDFSDDGVADFQNALDEVWAVKEAQLENDKRHITSRIAMLSQSISTNVEAATDPVNASIKTEILALIAKKKAEVEQLEDQLDGLIKGADTDRRQFLEFAYQFLGELGKNFLEISAEDRMRCKQALFPSGFYLDESNKVYTPEISPLITLASNKKDATASDLALLVRVAGL